MPELNQPTKRSERGAARWRAAIASAAILTALFISMPLTMKAGAVGQVTIIVSDAGMTPASATVNGGIVHLKIENSSARNTLTLRISRESGSVVREIVLPDGIRELSTEVEIGAGQYVVTETSNTSWNCALTIQ